MSEWNYVRNSAAGSLWGAPNQLSQDGKNYRRSLLRRQKWRKQTIKIILFIDYFNISGYNKSTIAYSKYTEVFYYG